MSTPTFDEEAFARMLQGAEAPAGLEARRMAALVAALERARPAASTPPFATALRERIVVEAERAARIPMLERVKIAWQARNEAWRRSFRVVTATGLAAMLMLGTGAAFASSREARPDQWNYVLKRAQEGARLAVTRGPVQRGLLQLEFARTRLEEVRALAAADVSEDGFYIDTLNDMDASTITGAELLIKASRQGAGIAPLRKLAAFTAAQHSRLAGLVDRVPVGARPAARDSVGVLEQLSNRVADVIAGCPCPANPLELPGTIMGLPAAPSQVPCACERTKPRPSGDEEPIAGGPTPGSTPPPTPPATPGGGSDVVPGTDSDEPVNDTIDQINDILEDLGLPTLPPTPVPTALPTVPGL